MSRFWSPVVHSLSPYVPGEQPKQDGIVKLNTNENPYAPSPRVTAAIAAASERLRLYPDPGALRLREAIAARYGVAADERTSQTDDLRIANSMGHLLTVDLSWKWLPKTAIVLQVSQGYITYFNSQNGRSKPTSYPLHALGGLRGLITAKLAINLLAAAGLSDIEVASFVHPKWVPQLADAEELVKQLAFTPNLRYSALVPNMKGLDRALASGIRRIAVFTAASETFNRKNINMGVQESIDVFKPVVARALKEGISVRGYVSTCFVCPYEGPVAKEKVADVTRLLFDLGVDEISIGDTIGAATPKDIETTVGYLLQQFPAERLAMHFHDTYGMAVANVYESLQMGIAVFDSSAAARSKRANSSSPMVTASLARRGMSLPQSSASRWP